MYISNGFRINHKNLIRPLQGSPSEDECFSRELDHDFLLVVR
jgi:hypothetical protein